MWDDFKEKDLLHVFSKEGMEEYAPSFQYLVGEKLDWNKVQFDK